jgi:hypothetical protein
MDKKWAKSPEILRAYQRDIELKMALRFST